VSHYYLLVLVNKEGKPNCNDLQDRIENSCRNFIPVTAIVLDINHFNAWLTEGHPFANKVVQIAECIHDVGNIPLVIPTLIDEVQWTKLNEMIFSTGLNKVQEFLAGADLFRIREQNKMAAFMLHQATEQALHTLFKITTGMYIHTHNLDKLIRYCSMVSYKLPGIFPKNNEKNERLFQLLQKAYVGSRYDKDYSIFTNDLIVISERIRELEKILKDKKFR